MPGAAPPRSARQDRPGRSTSLVLNARCSAPLSLPLALAASSSARSTPIHAPRPGARARTSGATCRRGRAQAGSARPWPPLRRVRTQVRSGTCALTSSSVSAEVVIGRIPQRRPPRLLRPRFVLEPVGAGGHDDLVALLFGEAVFGEDPALVLGAVARLARRRGSTRFFWISSSVARSARSSSVLMFALPSVTSICSVRCGSSASASSTPSLRRSSRDAASRRSSASAARFWSSAAMSSSRPSIEAISSTGT